MAVMRSMIGGVETLEWDNVAAESGDEQAERRVEAARARFERHRRAGGEVFTRQPSGAFKRATEFDAEADELLLVPPVAGG